ncbi:G2/mitotic-specific cyclin cdc13 [Grifola frondosa]|uniref:G2/mitotic-specific cyclin cdc13 n=1 Tax=Grifola frondosa TaxID=5627 RepID=A0A1C7M7X8_GRIFR|nr:G2/mitotic-specific cyclin cdc13 [Grifola frondosa]
MANNVRLPMRNRTGPQRTRINGDENSLSRHVRQPSGIALAGASRLPVNTHGVKNGVQRPALGEVTTTAVNRKLDVGNRFAGKEKEPAPETGLKRSRSSSLAAATGPQRVPLGPSRVPTAVPAQAQPRVPLVRVHRPQNHVRAVQRVPIPHEPVLPPASEEEEDMDIENHPTDVEQHLSADEVSALLAQEIEEAMAESDSETEDIDEEEIERAAKRQRIWPEVSTERAIRYRREVDQIRETFEDEVDEFDTTMVSEYADEIFEYMNQLEEEVMPSANYMDGQTELTWEMRQNLVDWLLQLHLRYHMLPETLWIAVNIVDRFLTKRVVSAVKLQLAGITAMFIAAKYEEILAPSVDEFVILTQRGYSKEDILKGERIMLQTLDFKISQYCSPYSWMRKISRADDYDIQTRTLSKFLTEVTLIDYRFLRVKPSMIAAIGMYTARRMLGGDWSEAFVFHSGFTEEHLLPGHKLLIDKLTEEEFTQLHIWNKYAQKKFLKAAFYAVEWAHIHIHEELAEGMNLEE